MSDSRIKKITLVLLLSTWMTGTALGNEEPITYDRVNLSANATTQLENDTLVAVLFYQREGANLAGLASEVNEKITAAVKTSKKLENVDIQTEGYQSNPIYDKQRLTGWRVRQSIRLQSRDMVKLSKLIGDLQNTLALESVSFSVSPDRLRGAEDKLIVEAIDAFKNRALLITKQFGRGTYRLVNMSINTGGLPFRPLRSQTSAMSMQAAPPTLEAGKREIEVNINGTIELQLD